jgi:hypothetical protein
MFGKLKPIRTSIILDLTVDLAATLTKSKSESDIKIYARKRNSIIILDLWIFGIKPFG